MIHYATPEQRAKIESIVERMVLAVNEEPMALVAVAALRLAIGVWRLGGLDRLHVEACIRENVDGLYQDVPKAN
jgi:hypothetical protein